MVDEIFSALAEIGDLAETTMAAVEDGVEQIYSDLCAAEAWAAAGEFDKAKKFIDGVKGFLSGV